MIIGMCASVLNSLIIASNNEFLHYFILEKNSMFLKVIFTVKRYFSIFIYAAIYAATTSP